MSSRKEWIEKRINKSEEGEIIDNKKKKKKKKEERDREESD